MFRLQRASAWLCAALVLPSLSPAVFTAVYNRIGRSKDSKVPESASVTNRKEPKAHQPNNDYGKLPIYFEPNLGQTDPQVKFIVRCNGVTTFLTATEAVFSMPIADFGLPNGKQSIKRSGYADPAGWGQDSLDHSPWNFSFGHTDLSLGKPSQSPHSPQSAIANRQSAITMRLVGANPNATIEGLNRLPGHQQLLHRQRSCEVAHEHPSLREDPVS